MQRQISFGILAAALTTAGTANSQVTMKSRNMPAHCEFVYQVQSEIEIFWEPGNEEASLAYELFEEYSQSWQSRPAEPLDCSLEPVTRCKISLAFESMSTAQHHLFRKIRFHFVNDHGAALSDGYWGTFGREFGEQCYAVADQTPFRAREVFAAKE